MTTSRIIIETEHLPPSTNNLYFSVPGKGRVKTDRYRTWREAAGWDFNGKGHVAGNYAMILSIDPRKVRKGRDLSNFIKPVEDLAVAHGLVDDDSQCVHVSALYEHTVKGMRVEIIPARAS